MSAALVVEDDEPLAGLLCHSLRKAGIHASSCSTAEEATRTLAVRAFHFVVLDLTLPGSSGLYVIEAVRRMEGRRRPAVVVLTASRGPVLDKIDRSVVKAVIFKPVDVNVVASFLLSLARDGE